MKRNILLLTFLLCGFIIAQASDNKSMVKNVDDETSFTIPADVQKIIDNSCFGCHNTESKNEKGKKKLTFDTMGSMEVVKLVGELGEIAEVVENDDMPPAKFLEFKPEAKLTKEQKEALVKWAEEKAGSLLN